MEEILQHPAIQGGIAPFVIALIISLVFMRVHLLAGFAVVAGFVCMIQLTTGFSFSPMTSTRKVTLMLLIVPVVAFLLQCGGKLTERLLAYFYVIAGIGLIWVLWPVIARDPVAEFFPALSYFIYAAWMMGMFMRMSELPAATAGLAATTSGFAIGGTAIIGASAFLGQMGFVLAATGGAFLLVQLVFRREEFAGLTFTMTSGLMAALLLPTAIVYAKVPWLVLPLVAIVPLIIIYPFADEDSVWQNTVYLTIAASIPIGLALYLTWQSAGALFL